MTELEKFFTKLNDNLDAEKAANINASFCFKIGGSLMVSSHPGHHTRLTLNLPGKAWGKFK